MTDIHFKDAEHLIGKHSFTRRLRTLDALQLAVALDLASQTLLDHFVIADRALGEVAALEGLSVIDPERSSRLDRMIQCRRMRMTFVID